MQSVKNADKMPDIVKWKKSTMARMRAQSMYLQPRDGAGVRGKCCGAQVSAQQGVQRGAT